MTYDEKVSNSGLTQLGCPDLLRRDEPKYWRAAKTGSAPKKTMIPVPLLEIPHVY